MKLSFSLQSKHPSSKSKPSSQSQDTSSQKPQINHEFLTEFDPSRKPLVQENAPKKLVIPPIQNEWRPTKKMKNLDLPPIHSEGKALEFETESSDFAAKDSDSQISYGLNLRKSENGKDVDSNAPNSVDAILLKKLKTDLDRLPEDEGFDQFNEVPVESFAEAIMAGYGWKQGMGIGRNAKEDVKVVEYKRRSAKEGLGFTDNVPGPKVGIDDGSNKKESKDGKLSFGVGKEVRIIGGKEIGLKGRVMEVLLGGDTLVVKLSHSEDEVKVRADEVAELGSVEEDNCLKKLKELKIRGSKEESRDSSANKSKDLSSSERKESKRGREKGRRLDIGEVKHERMQVVEKRSSSNKVPWLRNHIRVRIVSKSFKGGRFYLKKGEVLDVVGPTTCDILMDDSKEFVQGVDQAKLETAIPKRGGPVLVLFGKHKGAYGRLVERDTEREIGVVQDADSRELLHVQLAQIAEYAGDPSYIGY